MIELLLYKAKRIDTGEWVEGHYYSQVYHEDTIEEEWYHFIKLIGSKSWEKFRIDPDTLCPCTGLTDKNDQKIFKNDIFKHYNKVFLNDSESYQLGLVIWDEEHCRFMNQNIVTRENYGLITSGVYEVVGNVFDNPEL